MKQTTKAKEIKGIETTHVDEALKVSYPWVYYTKMFLIWISAIAVSWLFLED